VAAARDAEHARAVAGQAALVAALCGGPAVVDLGDRDGLAELLARLQPDIIVLTASRLTWWRVPEHARSLPYGAWLPLHVPLVRSLMQARDAAGLSAPVVALPYPDAVGPALAGSGLAPQTGAGNVLETAAKFAVVTAGRARVGLEAVDVRLLAHHAPSGSRSAPSASWWRCRRSDRPAATARRGCRQRRGAARQPQRLHVPAPAGRPGGYPVHISRVGINLGLPPGMTESEAIAVNAVAARWDGVERIEPDGAFVHSGWVSDTLERTLGLRLERVEPADSDAIADDLEARLARV